MKVDCDGVDYVQVCRLIVRMCEDGSSAHESYAGVHIDCVRSVGWECIQVLGAGGLHAGVQADNM